ncbi:MAG: NADH-quinone oxidoreductase subunit D, partial [Planctomycetota bacterium]
MTTTIQGVRFDEGERAAPVLPRDIQTEEMVFNMGPQHPSTHGVLRVVVKTDGEVVLDCFPLVGNLHRCAEKILENLSYVQGLPYVDRMDYLGALNNELAIALAVEKAAQLEVPKRGQYLRVILCEINRVISHLFAAGQFGLDMGAFTPFLYMFREREEGITLLNEVTGGRLLYHYIRYGGVTRDVDDAWRRRVVKWCDVVASHMDEYNTLLTYNHIFVNRTAGVAIVDKETCLAFGCTGPLLRAAGVRRDLRKDLPYSSYKEFDFAVPVGPFDRGVAGDSWNRHRQRLFEVEESLRIIRQATENLPGGETNNPKVTRGWKAPPGEAYVATEAPRGELAFYFVSDGGKNPYRLKARGPSF